MKQEEIEEIMRTEFNLTEEHWSLIERHFWKSIRYYIMNPLLTRGRIMIRDLFAMQIKVKYVEKFIAKLESTTFKRISYQRKSIEFYKELLKTLRNERQTDNEDVD